MKKMKRKYYESIKPSAYLRKSIVGLKKGFIIVLSRHEELPTENCSKTHYAL